MDSNHSTNPQSNHVGTSAAATNSNNGSLIMNSSQAIRALSNTYTATSNPIASGHHLHVYPQTQISMTNTPIHATNGSIYVSQVQTSSFQSCNENAFPQAEHYHMTQQQPQPPIVNHARPRVGVLYKKQKFFWIG